MKRHIVGALLALAPVLAHEGEEVEAHSATEIFLSSTLGPHTNEIFAGLAIVAGLVFCWWVMTHGDKK